jgi:redox-sensitive bicupin YhaK (pirin superfamily)
MSPHDYDPHERRTREGDRGWSKSHFTSSAGMGVVHSEVSAPEAEPVHLMQIWIRPSAKDLPPNHPQVGISPEQKGAVGDG